MGRVPTITPTDNWVGDLCWWTLHEDGIAVKKSELTRLVSEHGLKWGVPDVPVSAVTMSRVAGRMKSLGGGKELRLAQEDDDGILYVIGHGRVKVPTMEVRDRMGTSSLDRVALGAGNVEDVLLFDKAEAALSADSVERGAPHPDAERVIAAFHAADGRYGHPDIYAMMTKTMAAHDAICLKGGSGFYFVPTEGHDQIVALKGVIEALHCSFLIWALYGGDLGSEALHSAASEDLGAALRALQDQIEKFDASTRRTTVEGRIKALDSIKDKAALYANILKLSARDLLEDVTGLERRLEQELFTRPEKQR